MKPAAKGDLIRTTRVIVTWNNWRVPVGTLGQVIDVESHSALGWQEGKKPLVKFRIPLMNLLAHVKLCGSDQDAELIDPVTAIGGLA